MEKKFVSPFVLLFMYLGREIITYVYNQLVPML